MGKIVGILFLIGCLAAAGYFFRDTLFPTANKSKPGTVDLVQFKKEQGVEAQDPNGITRSTSTSMFLRQSIFYKKYNFKVNLKLIDDSVVARARDTYATGESPILWGTLDMMAFFAPELMPMSLRFCDGKPDGPS